MEDGFPDDERGDQGLAGLGSPHCFPHQNGERVERYSRKVFVGGLPPDIDEGTLFFFQPFCQKHNNTELMLAGLVCTATHILSALFQTRSQPVSGVLDICSWTGLIKPKVNPTSHQKVRRAFTLSFLQGFHCCVIEIHKSSQVWWRAIINLCLFAQAALVLRPFLARLFTAAEMFVCKHVWSHPVTESLCHVTSLSFVTARVSSAA